MKKGQKRMLKFLNKTFKNAIILQQLKIDELQLIENREKWLQERQGAKVASEQKFHSGGATNSKNEALENARRSSHSFAELGKALGGSMNVKIEGMKDEVVLPKWVSEGLNERKEVESLSEFGKSIVESMKRAEKGMKENCPCRSCEIERRMVKRKKDD